MTFPEKGDTLFDWWFGTRDLICDISGGRYEVMICLCGRKDSVRGGEGQIAWNAIELFYKHWVTHEPEAIGLYLWSKQ